MNNKMCELVIVCRNIAVEWKQFNNPVYVGVESGSLNLIDQQLKPAFFCGDFDSVTQSELNKIQIYSETHNTKLFKSTSQKDMIDAEIAIVIAENQLLSFEKVFIISAGKRWDMVLAQINLVRKYQQYQVILIDEVNYVFTLKTGTEFNFPPTLLNYHYISLFPFNSQTLTYQFFGCIYYPGQKITINDSNVLAVSNEFNRESTKTPKLIIIDGDCLIVLTKKEKMVY